MFICCPVIADKVLDTETKHSALFSHVLASYLCLFIIIIYLFIFNAALLTGTIIVYTLKKVGNMSVCKIY